MDEDDFWPRLEFRLCREFEGIPARRLQCFWCDGLIPHHYLLSDAPPRITGKAWICNGPRQWE